LTIAAVADTHTALWHLFGDPQLSTTAAAFIEQAAAARQKIAVSSISLAELVYLVEKGALLSRATPKVVLVRLDRAETTLFSS
jgi:PIN domain nuclease of toxin-antitoxin system